MDSWEYFGFLGKEFEQAQRVLSRPEGPNIISRGCEGTFECQSAKLDNKVTGVAEYDKEVFSGKLFVVWDETASQCVSPFAVSAETTSKLS